MYMDRGRLVSVITPMYNSAEYLSQTVNSVLRQTYPDWELILIDDCSEDASLSIAKSFAEEDSRIKVVQMHENSGVASAINLGCQNAQGRFIAFLDSDDIWFPDKLQLQLAFMRENHLAITCTSYIQISEDGGKKGRLFKARQKVDYRRMLLDCPVGHSTVVYDTKALGIQIVPNIRKRSDDALWLQILKREPYIWGLQETLVQYRLRGNSLSRNKFSLVKYHWKLYREIEHMSILSSVFHIAYWGFIKIVGIK